MLPCNWREYTSSRHYCGRRLLSQAHASFNVLRTRPQRDLATSALLSWRTSLPEVHSFPPDITKAKSLPLRLDCREPRSSQMPSPRIDPQPLCRSTFLRLLNGYMRN